MEMNVRWKWIYIYYSSILHCKHTGKRGLNSLRARPTFAYIFYVQKKEATRPRHETTHLIASTTPTHKRTPTNTIYCPSATLVYRDLLGFLMSYCPGGDSLWLSRSATINNSTTILLASTHKNGLTHAPPTTANQDDLLPKRYNHIQRPLGLSNGLLPWRICCVVHELRTSEVGQLWWARIYRYM
jgi:hypothetical protein